MRHHHHYPDHYFVNINYGRAANNVQHNAEFYDYDDHGDGPAVFFHDYDHDCYDYRCTNNDCSYRIHDHDCLPKFHDHPTHVHNGSIGKPDYYDGPYGP